MTVDEFLGWTEGREGRWELHEGELVEKTPERPLHSATQRETVLALKGAIRNTGAPCHVTSDGAIVRISPSTAFEPDALVYVSPRQPPDAVEIPAPVIVVEVLSEATAERDQGVEARWLFFRAERLPLPRSRSRVSDGHASLAGGRRSDRDAHLTDGPLRLEPPGLAFFVEELFAPA